MFHRILFAVDLTETSPQVVEDAIAFAASLGAKLMLLNVMPTEDALYLPYSVYPLIDGYTEFSDTALGHHEQRVKAHEDKCRAVLENYRTQAQAQGVEAEIKLMTGEPGHAICDMVKEWRGDLILLGNRGLRGLKELVLGSVSSFVMHHAHCSVLILRDVQLQPSDQEKAPSEERKSCAVGSPH